MDLSGIEWWQWKRDEQTQKFLALLRQDVSDIQGDWLANQFVSDDAHKTLMLNAGALGAARAVQKLIDLVDDIELPEDNEGEGHA